MSNFFLHVQACDQQFTTGNSLELMRRRVRPNELMWGYINDLLSSKGPTGYQARLVSLAAYGHLPANFVRHFSTTDLES